MNAAIQTLVCKDLHFSEKASPKTSEQTKTKLRHQNHQYLVLSLSPIHILFYFLSSQLIKIPPCVY